MKRIIFVSALVAAAVASQAVTFSNVIINSAPLSNGSSFSTSGNSITFFTPNAKVGDGEVLRQGILSIQYDATSPVNMLSNEVNINLVGFTLGSGTIVFNEIVVALDSNGNELGIIGSSTYTFNSSSNPFWNDTIQFNAPVAGFRAKKSFVMSALDANPGIVNDFAALGQVNQNIQVVPEPATLAVLGLGVAAAIRRRRK